MTGKAAAVPMALSCGPSVTDFEVVLDRNCPRPFVAKLPLPMHVPYHPCQDKNPFRAAHYIPANEQLHCSGECEASVDVIARGVDPIGERLRPTGAGESEARRAEHGDEDLRHRASARTPVASDGLWRISPVRIGALGWTIVTPTLLGIFAGRWLDLHFGSGIFWTLGLLSAGLTLGCVLAWNSMFRD
jgi:ATP synthase protein I